ncbi:hypothetical protein KP509_23G037000 [Ceratopteris richardii]|nr:hypothetical protein KP509_23G037000 [Ceratopteris richardii]
MEDKLLSSLLIDAYGKCGAVQDARALFDGLQAPNCHSWNFMIRIHAQHNQNTEALSLFKQMKELGFPQDKYTFSAALGACSSPAYLNQGKVIHREVQKQNLESEVVVGTSLINMYGKCGSLDQAWAVFDGMADKSAISWTTMINVYTQYDHNRDALQLFHQMHMEGALPTLITYVSVLGACSNSKDISSGKHVHLYITCETDVFNIKAQNAIINLYAKCGKLDIANALFIEAPDRNVITWTTLITAYSQLGQGKQALELYFRMQRDQVDPNEVTFVSVLDACSNMSDISLGQIMHAQITETGLDDDTVLGTALLNLYGKCGHLHDARSMFKRIKERNLVTWSAMIGVYAQHGYGKKALALFSRLRHTGITPDSVTFIHILSACSRSGLVEEGRRFFNLMQEEYGIKPTVDHYGCMTDLFGRAGLLEEAHTYVESIPKELSIVPWRTMLGASRIQGDREHGEGAAERILELDPTDTAPYIMLSSVYAAEAN